LGGKVRAGQFHPDLRHHAALLPRRCLLLGVDALARASQGAGAQPDLLHDRIDALFADRDDADPAAPGLRAHLRLRFRDARLRPGTAATRLQAAELRRGYCGRSPAKRATTMYGAPWPSERR